MLLTCFELQGRCFAADSRGTGSGASRPGRTRAEDAWPSFTEFRGHGFTADSRGPGPNSAVSHPFPTRRAVHIIYTSAPMQLDQPGGYESAWCAGSQGFLKLAPASKTAGHGPGWIAPLKQSFLTEDSCPDIPRVHGKRSVNIFLLVPEEISRISFGCISCDLVNNPRGNFQAASRSTASFGAPPNFQKTHRSLATPRFDRLGNVSNLSCVFVSSWIV